MNPSEYDRKVVFERDIPGAKNSLNEPSENWSLLCSAWAQKQDVSDGEKIAAGAELSVRSARFRVRSTQNTRSLTTADRLKLDGTIWNIKGIKEVPEGRNLGIEVSAVTESGG